MTPEASRRVFDDENDRWIEVRDGETDRDALVRARRDGAPSVIPPRRPSRNTDPVTAYNRSLGALKVICGGALGLGILMLIIAASQWTPDDSIERAAGVYVTAAAGALIAVIGAVAGLLALAVAATRHRE